MAEFDEIYMAYFGYVERYLLAICKDQHLAEELTEQVFFQALRALPAFQGKCDIRTWLCSIGRNAYLAHLKKNQPLQALDDLELPDPETGLEEKIADKEQALQIHKIFHDLPEPYKEVFSLRVFGQLSFGEIGGIFGRPANWACVTYHRARKKIQEKLEVPQ